MTRTLKFLLFLYRKLRISRPTCRYYPSCSAYAEQSIERYGPLKGSFLALKRLIRCNPFVPGGLDPVP